MISVRDPLSLARLEQLLGEFPRRTIGLLGDLFLDRYLDIDAELSEVSVETGLEAYQVTRIRNSPGALGTVINNLAALGVRQLIPLSVIGDDGQAFDLLAELAKLPVDPSQLIRDPDRKTPTYTKPMKQDRQGVWHELNRLDLRNRTHLTESVENELLTRLDDLFAQTDGLIVLDQVNEDGWGVIGPRVREHLRIVAKRLPDKLIFVDSRAQIGKFSVGILKPNLAECLKAIGRTPPSEGSADSLALAGEAATELAARTRRPVFCTLSQQGIVVADPGEEPRHVPACPVKGPIDPVGAGDSATSGIVSSLLSGATPVEAAAVGNLVASITVTQLGTTGTASPDQLVTRWHQCRDLSD